MLVVHLAQASGTLKFKGTEYGYEVDADGDLEITQNKQSIAWFPNGHWKYVLNLPDETFGFTHPDNFEYHITYQTEE